MIKLDQAVDELAKITWAYNADSVSERLKSHHIIGIKPIVSGILANKDHEKILRAFFLELLDRDAYAIAITQQSSYHVQELMLANVFEVIFSNSRSQPESLDQSLTNLDAKISLALMLDSFNNEEFKETLQYLPAIAINPFVTQLSYLLRNYAKAASNAVANFRESFQETDSETTHDLANDLVQMLVCSLDLKIDISVSSYSQLFNKASVLEGITNLKQISGCYGDSQANLEITSQYVSVVGTPCFLTADLRVGTKINSYVKSRYDHLGLMQSVSEFSLIDPNPLKVCAFVDELARNPEKYFSYGQQKTAESSLTSLNSSLNLKQFIPVDWKRSQPLEDHYVLEY